MRIAIVGAGPRGLWAVEELVNLAWQRRLSLTIDVYDAPADSGVGLDAYDPNGPDHWLMNVTADIVDRFRRDTGNTETYPPRAEVGRHLQQRWRQLPVPANCSVTHISRVVTDPAALDADYVLVATGHTTAWPGALTPATTSTRVVTVYPHGSLDAIAAKSEVAIRGLSLTFIDAVLDLTLGRGGVFSADDTRYTPSGREPSRIFPYSRSGRFMVPKPSSAITGGVFTDMLNDMLLAYEPRLGGDAVADADDIAAVLRDAAEFLLGRRDPRVAEVLAGTDQPEDAVAELRHNIAVAVGDKPLDATAAVGAAFRALYPALVRRVSFNEPLPGLRELARRLERVAFGPPLRNARRVLALLDAGVVASPAKQSPAGVDVHIDAVLAPPPFPPVRTDRDGFLPGDERVAVVGRATEGWILGTDTLSRQMHDVIPRWARRVVAEVSSDTVHGLPPLPARMEQWARELTTDAAACTGLLDVYSSPVNVVNPAPMVRNVEELVTAGANHGVEVRVFYARKANKALTFVDTVSAAGHGVDVASYRELEQVLAAGVAGRDIILSAAIKPDALLQLAVDNEVTISVDTVAELERIIALARRVPGATHPVAVAPRLAPDPRRLLATRFGERRHTWAAALNELSAEDLSLVRVAGIHVHLHGYSATDRALALAEVFALCDDLAPHHRVEFVDIGGGVPMSYIDDAAAWDHFEQMRAHHDALQPFTWKSDPLATIYPYHQQPIRGRWLDDVLSRPHRRVSCTGGAAVDDETGASSDVHTVADELRRQGLRLHVEPGRSIVDGCGLTLARVEFVKHRADGIALVGLGMNRTQCRTTSDDFTIDPVHIPVDGASGSAAGDERGTGGSVASSFGEPEKIEAYLVGAYCIEDELILRRRIRFPRGVKPGDVVALPNTAGYFMHILESASHQIPLAKNVVWPGATLDRIDAS